MRALGIMTAALCFAAATAPPAQAEPIAISLASATSGFQADPTSFRISDSTIDLGTIDMSGAASGYVQVSGLTARENYTVNVNVVSDASPWTSLTAEILDPLSDPMHGTDDRTIPSGAPAGYSTSDNNDGISFAWNSGLDRSATFASGGQASLFVDEDTNQRDLIRFDGFNGSDAAVTFGLRDHFANGTFLVHLSTNGVAGGDPSGSQTPEPASLLLLGTGGAALFARRKRQGLAE